MEERVMFPVGDLMLEGLLSVPRDGAGVGVVICHPHPLRGGEMSNNVVSALTRGFIAADLATLRFNFRGVGRSDGVHDEGRGEIDDVKAAVTFLAGRGPFATLAVAGYSFGALVGLMAGAEDDRVQKLIGVALPIATRDASFLKLVRKPKLLISGDRDDYSPAGDLKALFAAMPEPKAMELITAADHFFAGLERGVSEAATAFLAN